MNEMKSTIESMDEVDDVMKPMSIGDANNDNNISIISISFKMMKSLLKNRSIALILLTSCSLVLFILILSSNKYSSSTKSPLDRRSNLKSLRIVQYNTEWLFIDYYPNSNCPGNGCTWKTESKRKYIYRI